ncbi:MAG: radical SAM protein [Sedimentisphaerales bacterium]|nr:radical SAM protein [Sedimentisphaerales bacterium]
MAEREPGQSKYIYGPVPSRRLGRSLGVDIVPAKICTLDCVYCQIGRTTQKSTVRQDFVNVEAVLSELRDKLAAGVTADYITLGGSGEPTLNSRLGELIDRIRALTAVPVALLTNGTLFDRADVRAEAGKADVVIPSLDAGDERVFRAVNRPAHDISIENVVSGLSRFRDEYEGQIWLEVFLIEGMNTSAQQIEGLKRLIARIRPDKVQLNSAVRPAAEEGIEPIGQERLAAIARQIGGACEIIGAAPVAEPGRHERRACADVLSMLKRRPCSLPDICAGLGITRHEAAKYLATLRQEGAITSERRGAVTYYFSPSHGV